jgi:hypothetical protein
MVSSARDPRCAALTAVNHEDVEVEPGKVDGGGQARRSAADDQAVENGFHPLPNGLPHGRFPTSPPSMNWTFVLIGFALAVFMGSALVSLLATIRPQWSRRRKRMVAASILPAITILAALTGILVISTFDHGESEHIEDLAIAAVATIGGGFSLLAWVGGLLGATLTSRRHRG